MLPKPDTLQQLIFIHRKIRPHNTKQVSIKVSTFRHCLQTWMTNVQQAIANLFQFSQAVYSVKSVTLPLRDYTAWP